MKKLLSVILVLILILAALPAGLVSAEITPQTYLTYDRMISNDLYTGHFWDNTIKTGTENTLYVQNLMYGGTPLSIQDVTFEWYKNDQIIEGETSNEITFTATVSEKYTCFMYLDGTLLSSCDFSILVDTILITPVSSHTVKADEDWQDSFFYVYDCAQNTSVSIGVNASSVVSGATLTYEWTLFDQWTGEETPLSETGNSITVTKGKGNEYYICRISDGTYTKWVEFLLYPVDTLTETIKINGVTPKRFERGYMAVAKVGDEVTLEVKTASTNGAVSYRWEQWDEYFDENDAWQQVMTPLGSSDSVTVTKREIEGDPYGFERFECYIDDGNEVIDVGFVLFLLDPNQVTTEEQIAENTPEVSLENTTEDLANSLLQENMEQLSYRETAKITLTAETVDELNETEKSAVDSAISQEDNIGACVDINLYKEISADSEQITETAGEIDLSLEVPEELRNSEYDYQIVRIHEGEAEVLNCEYDAESGKVSFATDKFSTYVLTYTEQSDDDFEVITAGWKHDATGWWYQNADGTYPTSEWLLDGGTWYYFNASGYMVTGWANVGGTWYYFNNSGAMTTGWVYDGAWYYMSTSGAMTTGWANVGGTWYYFNNSGAMATGWVYDGAWYYMSTSGAMATGWLNLGGTWYYMGTSGAMATGWQVIGGSWYYFYNSGAMASNCYVGSYWINANGVWAQ